MTTRPFYVAGSWRTGDSTFEVRSPYDGGVVSELGVPTDADVEEAVTQAVSTFESSRLLTISARAEALMQISRRIAERVDEFAESIAREGGKPLKWSKIEATRAIATFRWAAEEIRGEFAPATWQAFWLTAVGGRPPKEVASELGLSVGAVYIARSRILARLRQRIEELGDEATAILREVEHGIFSKLV